MWDWEGIQSINRERNLGETGEIKPDSIKKDKRLIHNRNMTLRIRMNLVTNHL